MPVYEYFCANCAKRFEALRPMSQADAAIACPRCGAPGAQKLLSVFAAISKGSDGSRLVAGNASSGCSTCASHNCATCGSG